MPDLYKYKALRLSYENASIFAAFALVAFIPASPFLPSSVGGNVTPAWPGLLFRTA